MTGMIPASAARLVGATLAVISVLAVGAGAAGASEVIYNNIPGPTTPTNVPSIGFEATSTAQFGGAVQFAGTARKGLSVTVGMSTWACEKGSWTGSPECLTAPGGHYEWPITLNVYEVGPGNTVGALIKTVTRTLNIPFRKSQNNVKCKNEKGEPSGAWYEPTLKQCFHGKFFKITYMLRNAKLPANAIVSVAYNTSDYGAEPQRSKTPAGGPYDSLNVGLNANYNAKEEAEPVSPSVGAYAVPAEVFVNSAWSAMYCGNAGATGSFGPSGACWTYEQPTIEVKAN